MEMPLRSKKTSAESRLCVSVIVALLAPLPLFAALVLGASVAGDTVVKVANAFFLVLGTNVCRRVLVATETRRGREDVVGMTSLA